MSKPVIGVYALIALALILGSYVRLDVLHADTASFVSFLTAAIIPAIPAVAAWLAGRKAHVKASEANQTAQVAVNRADTAATAATAAESNTNGKLTQQFLTVHNELGEVKTLLVKHLADHAGGK
jgi:hypothetical protein